MVNINVFNYKKGVLFFFGLVLFGFARSSLLMIYSVFGGLLVLFPGLETLLHRVCPAAR